MVPIQPLTVFRIAAAWGLFTVTLFVLVSTIVPPPLDAIHSRASHVSPSYALPWKTKPAKVGLAAFSPSRIFCACICNSSQVRGALAKPYFCSRSRSEERRVGKGGRDRWWTEE